MSKTSKVVPPTSGKVVPESTPITPQILAIPRGGSPLSAVASKIKSSSLPDLPSKVSSSRTKRI